ncbi:MAG: RNA polymerase sporulation sigma factor SigK [Clostridia bacterium]|nr:RNA polymerase sporulation sigma factor SigK [Clostridia bacterium]
MFGLFDSLIESIVFLISFVSGNMTFPKTLTAKEEKLYIEKMESGDVDAKNKLIEHNLRLVAHIAKKYSGNIRDNEDLISLGTIGLIKAINSFDSSKGTRLVTYAARCIENEILMLMRSNKKTQGDVSLNDPIGTDKEGNQILLMDIIGADEEDVIKEIDKKSQIKKLYENIKNRLDIRERRIIEMRYGLGDSSEMTQSEIAEIMGISRSYVSRIEKKAIEKLKYGICDEDI